MIEDPIGELDRRETGVLRVTFADAAGGAGVATACTFRFRDGLAGSIVSVPSTDPACANPSPNVFTCRRAFDTAGRTFVEVEATAGITAIVAGWVLVRPSAFD